MSAGSGWVRLDAVVIAMRLTRDSLPNTGRAPGTRAPGLLASALARPQHLVAYARPDEADLAAAHGRHRSQPSRLRGQPATAFVAVEPFLDLDACTLGASDADCLLTMLELAAGDLDEFAFSAWIRSHLQPAQNRK